MRTSIAFNMVARGKHTAQLPKKVIGLHERPEPHAVNCDYIGPPDSKSNLRPYVRHIGQNETPLVTKLRLRRLEVESWNHDFWSKHNSRFYEEKADFIRLHNLSNNDELTADQMSVFYKHFLDKNRRMHILYNISWYLKNFELLMLSLQVAIQRLIRRTKNK